MKITLTLFMLLYFTLSGVSQCVNDTIPPVVSCANSNLVLNSAGVASASPYLIAGLSSDNCGITSFLINGQTLDTFNCGDLGHNTAVLTAFDLAGNSSSCVATITVIDTMVPVASCVNSNLVLNSAGVASASPYLIWGISPDNCGITTLLINGQALDTFDCSHLGNNTATLTVFDRAGNSSSCVATITVIDTMAPVISCQNLTIPLSNSGLTVVPAHTLTDTLYDNCGIDSVLFFGMIPNLYFDCSDLGVDTFVITSSDFAGNTSTCTSIVTVIDTMAPIVSCQNLTVSLSSTGTVTVPAQAIMASSSSNCGTSSFLINGLNAATFTCADLGTNTAVLSVTDVAGNTSTCVSTITVIDMMAPVVSCQNLTVSLSTVGFAAIPAHTLADTIFDNCGINSFLVNGLPNASFTCGDLGTNTVVLSVTDFSGNTSTCTSIVTVIDTIAPVVSCANSNLVLPPHGFVVASPLNIAGISSDNCGISHFLINGQMLDTFNCSNIGINTAVLTAVDLSGNTSTCSATITVIDTTSPVVSCQNLTVPLSNVGFATIPAHTLADTIFDNCGINNFLVNGLPNASFTCGDLGTNTVVLSVTDFSGNISTCISTITVIDNITPIAICNNNNVNLSHAGVVTITPSQIDSSSYDNCGIVSYLINGQSSHTFDCNDLGLNPITLTVIDASGNADSCISYVNIVDSNPPVASCNNTTVYLSNTSPAFIYPTQIDNGSSDVCGIAYMQINGQDSIFLSCADIGVQPLTLTVVDFSGNTSTCTSIVTILDTIDPIANCINTTAYLSNTGLVVVSPSDINNGSFDNCSILSYLINGQPSYTFNCNDLGLNPVTLMVVDASGNTDSCSSIVNVIDSSAFCALSATTISQMESMIHVYPNPVSSILNIESKEGSIQQLRLTSLAGQLILDKNITNSPNNLKLDLSSFPNAVYLLTIITEEGRFTEKIILQR
jgi:hypothetical protein